MTPQISRADGASVSMVGDVLHLEEDRSYFVVVPPEAQAWLGERELRWNAEKAGFELPVVGWAGSSKLRLVEGSDETSISVEVSPRAEKLSERTWLALLADLEAWTPGISVGLSGGGVGAANNEGAPAPVLAVALLPLVPALVRAVRAVVAAPRELTVSKREDVPLHKVRRADRETLAWLVRHPSAAQALDPWQAAALGLREPRVPQDTSHETVDHPVNRYLAWMVKRIARSLGDLAEALTRAAAASSRAKNEDTAAWCRARAGVAQRGADDLTNTLRRTFLGKLTPMPPTEAALLAVQDDPTYARAHALARPFLSPRFRLRESPEKGEAPVRQSFDLYELWTLLAVQRALAHALPGWTWTWHGKAADDLLAGFGHGSQYSASGPDGARIDLWYNLTFGGYLTRGTPELYSISGERRPDLVMTYQAPGQAPAWVVLDAKYRVERSNLAEAFESLHIYRDSLRWEPFGGRCRGGLLLVPAKEPACAAWFGDGFREQFGIGAWRLTPGEGADGRLAEVVMGMARGSR